MDITQVNAHIETLPVKVYDGYAPTGARAPYVVTRPLFLDAEGIALDGSAVAWDYQVTAYCVGASVSASFNLAQSVIGAVQGKRVDDSTLSASMGYTGAQVEGQYESQVTIQTHQGGLA